MPQLPNVASLERPTPRPGRGVVERPAYQIPLAAGIQGAGIEDEANARAGLAVADLGNTIADVQRHLETARRTAVLGEATGKATQGLAELELTFERDQDFRTAPKRFQDQAEVLRAKIEGELGDDALLRQAFNNRFRQLELTKRLGVVKNAARQEGDASVAALDADLDTYARTAASARSVAERAVVINQATVRIAEMRAAGWITDVDAGTRQRGLEGKIDAAMVTRDMVRDPGATANRLAADPDYAPRLEPRAREQMIGAGWTRAEALRRQEEAAEEKRSRKLADDSLTDAYGLLANGQLTRSHIEALKYRVSPAEYRGLLEAVKKQGGGKEDNRAAFAEIQSHLADGDYDEARRTAFAHHAAGRIKDSTLSATITTVLSQDRREGPRTPFQAAREFVTNSLRPSPMIADPVPQARMGMAIKEFDDRIGAMDKPTKAEIDGVASEVIKKFSLVNMNELVVKTGVGTRDRPEQTLEQLRQEGERLTAARGRGELSSAEFNRRMAELNRQREAAEAANRGR